MSSTSILQGVKGTLAYAASKTGIIGMSRVFAKEYGQFNITSNVLILGWFQAGLMELLSDELQQETLAQIPMKKFGDTKDISRAIEFLIESEYSNGSTINLDGGL